MKYIILTNLYNNKNKLVVKVEKINSVEGFEDTVRDYIKHKTIIKKFFKKNEVKIEYNYKLISGSYVTTREICFSAKETPEQIKKMLEEK